MNRASRNAILLYTFLCFLTFAILSGVVWAQNRGRTPRTTASVGPFRSRVAATPQTHPFYPANMPKLPAWVTRRTYVPKSGSKRAPGDQGVIRQTILLTNANPNTPFPITPAASENQHPFWTADEKYIYFDSNRNSETDSGSVASNPFNIFRMYPDGSGIVQIAPDTKNQLEPSVTTDGSNLAFVAGGQYTAGAGTATPQTTGFNLYILNLNNPGAATPLTNLPGTQFPFTDVRHPSWSPGGDAIAFAGKLQGQATYHIFFVTVSTGSIVQVTNGASNDYSPAWSPDNHLIAFTTNAAGFTGAIEPLTASGTVGNDDIYVVSQNPVQPNPLRVTNFAVGGKQSSNRNPSWSTRRVDPQGQIPPETDQNGNVIQPPQSEQLLAFASNRVDTNNDGNANAIGATTDIYWLHAAVRQVSQGVYTVATPESSTNPALKLRTSAPDAAIDPNEPTAAFDPGHTTNEDFPTWPQYQSSYRIVFQSDRGGVLEIWGSTILDLDAPSLLKYDQSANEIVHIERDTGSFTPQSPGPSVRQVNAGERVRFVVLAADYESGVESVFLQIKCPDSLGEGPADNAEHKVFVDPNGAAWIAGSPTSPTFAINAPFEFDAQAVDATIGSSPNFARFKTKPYSTHTAIPAGWPVGNLYTPGVEDDVAFSGGVNVPDVPLWVPPGAPAGTQPVNPPDGNNGCWLQLQPIGNGYYSGTWNTPASFPSDWIVDVVLRDKAVDPFNTTATTNWKIYDNVWGFTTRPFLAQNNILYVSDYDTGQKFLGARFGSGNFNTGRNFLSMAAGGTGLPFSGTPTESYMTEFDPSLFPTTEQAGTGMPQPLTNFKTTLGINSYTDFFDDDGTGFPPTQRYDIWRIQCRGPIPQTVLNQYLPHYETQPPDIISGGGPKQVLVAERCVLWHAPFTGDLFVGPGTLLDGATQSMLSSFVANGGRLFLCGQDVAWGLTLGGTTPNQFLNQTMHVQYVADDAYAFGTQLPPAQSEIKMLTADPKGFNRGGLPIGWETWYPSPQGTFAHDYPPIPPIPNSPPGTASNYIGSTLSTAREFGAPDNDIGFPDVVSFSETPTGDVSNVDGSYNDPQPPTFPNGTPAIMWFTDSSVNSRIVFSPFGWESLNPETASNPGGGLMLLNHRMEMMHNVLDYLRTGRIIGHVRAINPSGGATSPLGGVFVRATSEDPYNRGTVVATARTQGDGSYVLSGLIANGVYGIDAAKAGFVTQHATSNQFHGSYQSTTDFFMTEAQPGKITGTITVFGTGAPVQGAVVEAIDMSDPTNPGTPILSSPSDQNGNYVISVPSSPNYTIQVTPNSLTQLGFVASVPPSYTNVAVATSQTVSGENFQLQLPPGSIVGFVHVADANGNDTGVPIKGATITATLANPPNTVFTSAPPTGGSQTDGTYSIPNVTPGPYGVIATAPGFAPSASMQATVVTKQPTTVNFLLKQIPPGKISGLVATSTGIPVSGATITVVDAAGNTLPTVTTGAPQTVTGLDGQPYTFNYVVTNVPAGDTVQVTATKPGYTPKPNPDTQSVAVQANTETQRINFTLDPLFVFNNDLTLVSSPFTYTTDGTPNGPPLDIVSLLGVPAGDVSNGSFEFITWDATKQHYVSHPTPPADTFHLGVGYFMQDVDLAVILALTNPNGIPAPKDASGNYLPFNIPLQNGWNMIGMPFNISVDFSQLQIQDTNGTLVNVPAAQTGGNPALGAALWTYEHGNYEVVYTMDPFRGYWLRAFRPVTLIVTPNAQQGRAALGGATRALEFGSNRSGNWKLDIVATAGSQVQTRATLGAHSAATDQYDQYKMEAAPAVSQRNVTLTFDHTDWTNKSGGYAVDVRSATATAWNFTVRSNITDTPVVLTWPTLAKAGRHQMLLTDLDGNVTFDLQNRASYTIPASHTPITHHFRLEVHRATRPTLELTDVAVNMAPSRVAGAPASASISYNLTSEADVQITVMQAGRRIRSLSGGTTRAAGPGAVTWDLKNDRGVPVSANVYTVEVRAVGPDGHMVHQQRPLVITR